MHGAVRSSGFPLQRGPMTPQIPRVARRVTSIFATQRTFPRAASGISLPFRLPQPPRQHPRWQSWLSPMPRRVPPGTRPTPTPSMLCVLPPFA